MKKILLLVACCFLMVAGIPTPAAANHSINDIEKYFTNYEANNRWHSFKVTETNAGDRAKIEAALGPVLAHYSSKTDMSMYQDQNDWRPDVFVYATPNLGSDARVTSCTIWVPGGTPGNYACHQRKLLIDQAVLRSLTDAELRSLICHEILHTIGFIDMSNSDVHHPYGCLPQTAQGRFRETLSAVEIAVINRHY